MTTDITIIGLGPGSFNHLTVGALETMKRAGQLYLRTAKHPLVKDLTDMGIQFSSFDHLYEQSSDFEEVYTKIAEALIEAVGGGPAVFAVPGHPTVGEKSVNIILKMAQEQGIICQIMPAMSFLDPLLAVTNADISGGIKLIDGIKLMEEMSPDAIPDPNIPNVIMQVYSPLVASEVKISLMEFYPDEHLIKVIRGAGIQELEKIVQVPLFEMDRLSWIDHLTCVYVPALIDTTAKVSRFPLDSLVDCMERLRDVDGCPWDREQTHLTLKKYMVEETYEVLDAIDEGNMYKVCEELGDLLLQVAFHAQIARESGHFDINDVTRVISEKLVRRHPHIYGTHKVNDSEDVSFNWEEIKKKELHERGEVRESRLDGIPKGLPGLAKADKIQRKAAKVGFDWPDYQGAYEKIIEETEEVKNAISLGEMEHIQEELGDLLFAVVNLARILKIDSEEALSGAIYKFKMRFLNMEQKVSENGKKMEEMSLSELDRLWEEAKETVG